MINGLSVFIVEESNESFYLFKKFDEVVLQVFGHTQYIIVVFEKKICKFDIDFVILEELKFKGGIIECYGDILI